MFLRKRTQRESVRCAKGLSDFFENMGRRSWGRDGAAGALWLLAWPRRDRPILNAVIK